MKNVLFLSDKWIDGRPELGVGNNYHNLFLTFNKSCPNHKVFTLYYDESALIYGAHINQVLVPYCRHFKIDVVFLSFLGDSHLNPSREVLQELKQYGAKIVVFWNDGNPLDLVRQRSLGGVIDSNVYIDGRTMGHDANEISLWTPESSLFYYPDKQDITYSFIGSLRYPERAEYVKKIKEELPDFTTAGGQREDYLSIEGYASLIRRSQIVVNFSKNPMANYEQIKGRVFEATASKCFLLEEKNSVTSRYFKPGLEYIEFDGEKDLIEKLQFYRDNTLSRMKIAQAGHSRFIKDYTPDRFWERVLACL